MARKKVIDLNAETTVKFGSKQGALKAGSTVSGYYIGSKKVETSMGPSIMHVLQTSKGTVGVWGSAQLNSKLGQVPPGSMTFIKYVKDIRVPKGSMKVFDVEFDDEDSQDVSDTQVNFRNDAEPESSDESYAEESEEELAEEEEIAEEEDVDLEPAPAPRAARPAAAAPAVQRPKAAAASPASKARVNDILNRRK